MFNGLLSPLKVGTLFGLLGASLTAVGIARGNVPLQPVSISLALLIGGGMWFIVSWAVATAVADVEGELNAEIDGEGHHAELHNH